jgi:hypothetical protein
LIFKLQVKDLLDPAEKVFRSDLTFFKKDGGLGNEKEIEYLFGSLVAEIGDTLGGPQVVKVDQDLAQI